MKIIKKFLPFFAFLISIALFAIIFAINKIYPFGNLSVSWCDMDQQTIPLLCEFKDILSGKRDFWLSMQNAGGMNFYGVYFFNLSSPFTYIVAFFDKADMALAVNLMVALKLATASATLTVWLKYAVKNANPIIILSVSLLYAFSGWAMMYYQILSWLDTYYLFPILLLGLQKITEEKSPLIYILSLFACMLVHFYLGYAIVVFVCLYGAIFVITCREKRNNFAKNFILSSLVSALLSMVVLIPVFLQYLSSMRSGNVIYELAINNFYPPIQTSFPTFFCMIVFIPFMISAYRFGKTNHLFLLFILMLIPVFVEPIAMAWQTYDYMAFPTRYGFITIALGLTLAVSEITDVCNESIKQIDKNVTKKKIISVVVSLVLVAFIVAFAHFSKKYFNLFKEDLTVYSRSLWGSDKSFNALGKYYAILLVFGICFYFALKFKLIKKIAVYALIALLCITEVFFSSAVYMVAPANENKAFTRAMELENVIQDDDFYRVKVNSKVYHANLTGALGYNSLSHYTSLNRESYMIAMKQLGYSSYWMEVNSNGGTVFTDALLRNKYLITQGASSKAEYQTKDYFITKNEILFPTAFIIDKAGENESDLTLERWELQDQLFKRLTNKSSIHEKYSYSSLVNLTDNSQNGVFKFDLNGNGNVGIIKYTVNVEGEKSLYFDYYDKYSNALREHTNESIESIEVKKGVYQTLVTAQYNYPSQQRNGAVYLGTFKDTTVSVIVKVKKNISGETFGVYSVDNNLLKNAVNELIRGDFVFIKDHLQGKILAKNGNALFTSLPYDESFRVKINGKKVQTFSVNGFLAIELNEGENNVFVDFLPRGLILGVSCCFIGIIALLFYLIFYKRIQEFIKLDKFAILTVIALGVFVLLAIYIAPVFINLLM